MSSGLCISLRLHVALVTWAPFQHRPPHSLRWSETRSPWVAKMDRRGASVRFNEAAKLGLRDHKCWGCYKKTTSSQAAKVWQRSERCGCSHSMNVWGVNWFWLRKQNKGKSGIDKTLSGSPIFLLHLDASSLNFSGVVKYPSWNAIYHPLFLKRLANPQSTWVRYVGPREFFGCCRASTQWGTGALFLNQIIRLPSGKLT